MRRGRWLCGAVLTCLVVLLAASPGLAAPWDGSGLQATKAAQQSQVRDRIRQAAATAAMAPAMVQLASQLGQRQWSDAEGDNAGQLDIWNFTMGSNDDGSLLVSFTFSPPVDLTDVGPGGDWVSVYLDVDGAIGTGEPVSEEGALQPAIGYDYLLDFYNSSGAWTADIYRTPSVEDPWTLEGSVAAWQGTNTAGATFVATEVPFSLLNDPAHIHFIAFTDDDMTGEGDFETDWLPEAPVIGEYDVLVPKPNFIDVAFASRYATQIADLADRGIILGYPNGNFGPNDRVKRQQFAKMIVLALGFPTSEANVSPFRDVDVSGPASLYPDNYVAVCASHGITVGTAPGLFSPWKDISRAQLITMVTRAAALPNPPAAYVPPFSNFSDTHYPFARKAAYYGLLNGIVGVGPGFDFWQPATRGETAAFLYNLIHPLP